MSGLSTKQKESLAQLRGVIEKPDKECLELLRSTGWQVQAAIELAFQYGGSEAAAPAARARTAAQLGAASTSGSSRRAADPVDAEFMRLCGVEGSGAGAAAGNGSEELVMDLAGLERLAGELGVDPFGDIVFLYLLHLCNAAEQGVLRHSEFATGMARIGVNRVADLRAKVPALRTQLARPAAFGPFMAWAYTSQCEPGQKTISVETGIELSKLMITVDRWPLVGRWVAFLQSRKKAISKDVWAQLLPYMAVNATNVSRHDENPAWPVLLDEFRDWVVANPA